MESMANLVLLEGKEISDPWDPRAIVEKRVLLAQMVLPVRCGVPQVLLVQRAMSAIVETKELQVSLVRLVLRVSMVKMANWAGLDQKEARENRAPKEQMVPQGTLVQQVRWELKGMLDRRERMVILVTMDLVVTKATLASSAIKETKGPKALKVTLVPWVPLVAWDC